MTVSRPRALTRPERGGTGLVSRTTAVTCVLAVISLTAGCAGADDTAAPGITDTTSTSAPTATATPPAQSFSNAPGASPSSAPTRPAESGPGTTGEDMESLQVRIDGDDIRPNAQEIDLAVGESLLISFDTDRGGELHVHSKPEQYVAFPAGVSVRELRIETPGTVEIEEHDTEAVVAVLQVR